MLLSYGCSTFTPSETTLKQEKSVNAEDIKNQYCSGVKQRKAFRINLTLSDPKLISGLSTSESSKFLSSVEEKKKGLYKRLLFSLSKVESGVVFVEVSTDLFKRIEKEGMGSIDPNSLRANCGLGIVFLKSPQQQVKGYYSGMCTDGQSNPFFSGTDISFGAFNSYKSKLVDLSTLIDGFTMVEPKDFQKEAYDCDKNPDLCKTLHSKEELLGLDSNDEFDSKRAIEDKESIWKRYIARFSKVKESSSSNNKNESNVELSLDMNAFCRYERSISDLTSK